MKNIIFVSLILMIFTFCGFAQDKSGWLTGKVLDAENSKFFTLNKASSWRHESFVGAIEGEDKIYLFERVVSWRWEKSALLTVGAEVKYRIKKGKIEFIDENGRKMTGQILKQVLKEDEKADDAGKKGNT